MIHSLLKEPLYTFQLSALLPPRHHLVVNIHSRILSLVTHAHEPIVQQRILTPCTFRLFLALLSQPVGCSDFFLSAAIHLPEKEWERVLLTFCTMVLNIEESMPLPRFETTRGDLPAPLTTLVTQWQLYLEEAQRTGARREEIRFLQRQITVLRHDLEAFHLCVSFYDPHTGYRLTPRHAQP